VVKVIVGRSGSEESGISTIDVMRGGRSAGLHAGVVIAEHDRDALERLCRYGARPALALERCALVPGSDIDADA
jgi:hypothetical protein